MLSSKGCLPILFALVLTCLMFLSAPLHAEEEGNPYASPAPATSLSPQQFRDMIQELSDHALLDRWLGFTQKVLVTTAFGIEIFVPPSEAPLAPALALFGVITVSRPILFLIRELKRERLSSGQLEDPELIQTRDSFLLRTGLDPAKVGICARVARASLGPTDIAVTAAGLGLTGWTISRLRSEVDQVWKAVQIDLEKFRK